MNTAEDKRTGNIVRDPDVLGAYSEDALGIRGEFEGVCRPRNEKDVVACVEECAAGEIPLTAQGLRSSLTGASMCGAGIALSMEKMDRILDIDEKRLLARVEPGVILADLRRAVSEMGLFYPPDPTSAGECTLGGNVATNASGSYTLKYGSTKDWIRGLRVVDGRGRVITTRSRPLDKHCAGYGTFYHPTDLFVGSEGTLGIVTEIDVALARPPADAFLAMAFFDRFSGALNFTIAAREGRDYSPSLLEFFDESALEIIRPHAEGISIPEEARVMIYFEQEVATPAEREELMGKWFHLIETHTALSQETQIAFTPSQKTHLRNLRHRVPQEMNEESTKAVKNGGCKISTDWAVPYPRLPELFAYYETIKHLLGGIRVVRFGHLGEGHPHFNFIAANAAERATAEEVDALMARKAVELGGTIAGEHGIGKMKREHLALEYPAAVIEGMVAVKKTFDPSGILAPGNIFPDS